MPRPRQPHGPRRLRVRRVRGHRARCAGAGVRDARLQADRPASLQGCPPVAAERRQLRSRLRAPQRRLVSSPRSTGPARRGWHFGCAMPIMPMFGPWPWAPSQWTFLPAPWNCGCQPSEALAGRRCTSSTAIETAAASTTSTSSSCPGRTADPPASACRRSTTSPTTSTVAAWAHWARYYERLFNFREIRRFDIQGQQTGLVSRAMTAPGQQDPHPPERRSRTLRQRTKRSDRRLSAALQRRGHPAYRLGLRRSAGRLRPSAHRRRSLHGVATRHLLRNAGRAPCLATANLWTNWQSTASCSTAAPPRAIPSCCCRYSPPPWIGPIFFEFIERKRDEGFGEGQLPGVVRVH